MNRRKFLQNGAMAIVAASVAPVAVLSIEEFASGGIAHGRTTLFIHQTCDHFIPNAQMERITKLIGASDYYVHHEHLLYTGREPKKKWEFGI